MAIGNQEGDEVNVAALLFIDSFAIHHRGKREKHREKCTGVCDGIMAKDLHKW